MITVPNIWFTVLINNISEMNLLNSGVLSHKFFDKITRIHMLNFVDIIRKSVNKIAHHFISKDFRNSLKEKWSVSRSSLNRIYFISLATITYTDEQGFCCAQTGHRLPASKLSTTASTGHVYSWFHTYTHCTFLRLP